ncbi:MAG: 2-amino-4-hydroxy-6-hydroxymethyldihydropteridine diphosphokinase, partial [Planctomycetota bacterium]
MKTELNQAVIAVGSNIAPAEHVRQARKLIAADHRLLAASAFIQTKPVGFADQEDFLNGAFHIETALDRKSLKDYLL